MKKTNSKWVKFNDISSTVIKKLDISFFNKDQYSENMISLQKKDEVKKYQISIFLNKNELTQIRLTYKNKNSRDKDYKVLYDLI